MKFSLKILEDKLFVTEKVLTEISSWKDDPRCEDPNKIDEEIKIRKSEIDDLKKSIALISIANS